MDLLEHQGKQLLRSAGLAVPDGEVVVSPDEARAAAERIGVPVVCKAQITAGGRGKSGAVQIVSSADEAAEVAAQLLGSDVRGHTVEQVLIEQAVDIASEMYAAVLDDPASKGPIVLFSTEGGVDIEEVSAATPEAVVRHELDIRSEPDAQALQGILAGVGVVANAVPAIADALVAVHRLYREADASLVEINPLVLTGSGDVMALDAKVSIDASSVSRQQDRLDPLGPAPVSGTPLERRAAELGLMYIELDGEVGVLANGAGLTMTTLDAISHFGGNAANFLEIGGDAYTKATAGLELVLSNPNVRSLLVNFCGAFARTDVMAEGVVKAIEELKPQLPIAFTIHGTGEAEAIALVRERLGIEPYDRMDDAVKVAVAAAKREPEEVTA